MTCPMVGTVLRGVKLLLVAASVLLMASVAAVAQQESQEEQSAQPAQQAQEQAAPENQNQDPDQTQNQDQTQAQDQTQEQSAEQREQAQRDQTEQPRPDRRRAPQDAGRGLQGDTPRLGVLVAPPRAGLDAGVRILEVRPGSAADQAGLQDGDLLLELNGQAVQTPQQLSGIIQGLEEDRAQLLVRRGDEEVRLRVNFEAAAQPPAQGGSGWLGVALQATEQQEGVILARIFPGSPAARAGLMPGDILLAVNGEAATGVEEVSSRISDRQPGEEVELTVLRDGERRTLTATLAERREMPRPQLPPPGEPGMPPQFEQFFRGSFPDADGLGQRLEQLEQQNRELEQMLKQLQEQVEALREEVQNPQTPPQEQP